MSPIRDQPEQRLQAEVASKLRFHLPDEIWWSASMSGSLRSPHLQRKAKAMGLNRGAPDLSFIFPDGVTRYVELKAAKGRPTPEQARLVQTLSVNIAVCRSWQDVESALSAWMAPYGLRFLTDSEGYRRAAQRYVEKAA